MEITIDYLTSDHLEYLSLRKGGPGMIDWGRQFFIKYMDRENNYHFVNNALGIDYQSLWHLDARMVHSLYLIDNTRMVAYFTPLATFRDEGVVKELEDRKRPVIYLPIKRFEKQKIKG